MMLTKRDRNKIYEAIELYGLDPGEFNLEDSGDKVTITHSSGSVFEFSCRSKRFPTREFDLERYLIKASVPDGIDETSNAADLDYLMVVNFPHWLEAIRLTADAPDYWSEMQRGRELLTDIEQTDSANTPFTEEEQKRIVASLVSTYLTSGREGRQERAKVREFLFETEDTRWTDTDYKLFRQALSRLEAAALIARAPRKIVARYSYLANVAHCTQLAKEKADPGYPPRGLPYDLAGLIEMTIAILIEHLWHPVSKRRHIKRGIWLIDRAIGRTKEKHPDFAWNVQIFTSRTVTKEPGIRGIIHRFAARVSGLWMRFWSWLKR